MGRGSGMWSGRFGGFWNWCGRSLVSFFLESEEGVEGGGGDTGVLGFCSLYKLFGLISK